MKYDDFTKDQKKVVEHGKGALLVEAGPGSGKTTVIVERIKHLILIEGVDPESFLVITFTNKAADNLSFKLRKEFSEEKIKEKLKEKGFSEKEIEEEIKEKGYSQDIVLKMQISTIHSFCLKYLKSKNMSVTFIDDDASERKTLFVKKFKELLGFTGAATVFDNQIPDILKKFGEYTAFNVDSEKLLKTISENRKILPDYVDFVNSMDYFNSKLLEDYDKQVQKEIDYIKKPITKLQRELRKLKKEDDPNLKEISQIEEKINELKKETEPEIQEVKKKFYKKSWYNARFLQIIEAYPYYLDLLDEYNYVDFNTLQLKTLKELENDPNPPYKTIFVDEFQDTDPLQYRIFKVLREKCDYFTAVGDVDQHIYAFRSSFNDFFYEMKKIEKPPSISLNDNFRSTEKIVNLTEEFIKPQRIDSEKNMKNVRDNCNNPNFLMVNEDELQEANNIFRIITTLINSGKAKESDIGILYRKHSGDTLPYLIDLFKNNNINFSIKGQNDLSEQIEVKSLMTLLWYVTRYTFVGYTPSSAELDENDDFNLKAFCIETPLWSLDDSTKEYLCKEQQKYYEAVIDNECEFRGITRRNLVSNVKDRADQETIDKIFKDLRLPIINIEEITNPKDKEFFEKLAVIREKIREKNLTILQVFYRLIGLSNIYDYELNDNEIANLAILSQTISNYELFISETYARGALYFLRNAIENYDSYQEEGSGVRLMTIHTAKGLEFPVTIIPSLKEGSFPMINKDPNRVEDHINRIPTFYTPNDCLEFKTILKRDDEPGKFVYETLSISDENERMDQEEDRVLYVAMTRAKDLLILSSLEKKVKNGEIVEVPKKIDRIRESYLDDFKFELLNSVDIISDDVLSNDEGEDFVDDFEELEEPVVLNYSRYTKYLSCPFKYHLEYNLGFRRPGSAKAANRGSVFHEIMEKVNLDLLNGKIYSKEELEDITYEAYNSMFNIGGDFEKYKKEHSEDYEKYLELIEKVPDYYERYTLNRKILEAEYDFELFVDNYILNGSIDLIYEDSDGELVILDYKYAKYEPDHIDSYIKQSYIYAKALQEIPKYKTKIKKALIHFVLGTKDSDEDYIREVEINEGDMKEQFEDMKEKSEKIRKGIFEREPKEVEDCVSCPYRSFCKPKNFAEELYKYLNEDEEVV